MEIIWLKMENIWLKMEAIWLKMEAIWLKMEVVWPPGARSRLVFTPNRRPMKKRMAPGTSREAPGDPEGPQKSSKNCVFAKKGRSKRWFLLIFSRKAVFYALDAIFHQFSTKNRWKINEKNNTFFQCSACFFEHGDPHETSYFIMRKLLFHFSCICVFSKKKRRKMTPKCKEQFCITKSPKNGPRGPILGPKMDPN